MLRLERLSKHFGGVVATDEVSLALRAGEVHALIGPNGAGKTTLIGQICGSLKPDAGDIFFEGRALTHAAQHERVRAGLARSYQITSLFRRHSVLDNAALAVQAASGSSFSFWRPVRDDRALYESARAILADVSLAEKACLPAGSLAHGEQRALEVGLALASRPRLLLLDEPMAGMGPRESEQMIALLERLRSRVTLLLVEHDMDAVFRLADRISVLVSGRLIATDVPAKIKANPEVRKAYLGEEAAR